jgi:hypothetical protein
VQRVVLLGEKKAGKMVDQSVERKAGQWVALKVAY